MVNVCFWLYIVTTIIIRHYRSFATNNNIYSIITCDGSNIETWKSYLKLVFDFQSFSSAHLNMKEIRICTVVYGWQISTLKYCIVYSNIKMCTKMILEKCGENKKKLNEVTNGIEYSLKKQFATVLWSMCYCFLHFFCVWQKIWRMLKYKFSNSL